MPAGEQPPGEGSAFDRMSHLPERGKEPASPRVPPYGIGEMGASLLQPCRGHLGKVAHRCLRWLRDVVCDGCAM